MVNQVQLTRNSHGEDNILCQGKPLYSRYAPSATAERVVNQVVPEESCIYLIPSPLLGYGIQSLKSRLPSHSIIMGIEIEQSLMAISQPYLKPLTDPTFQCYRLDSSPQLYALC